MRSPIEAIRGPLGRTLTRYTVGSVAAMVVSEITLLLVYGLHVGGARTASAAAWASGAIVNYFLNRNWAWQRRGRAHPAKELLPYWTTAIAGLLLSMWATHQATAFAPRLSGDHTVATVLVGAAYLVTYGVLFVAKFLLFHYVIFTDRRSRTGPPAGDPGRAVESAERPAETSGTRAGAA
jgi:putative flippase GtrA